MIIYGIKVQYGKEFYWSLIEDELFTNELEAYKRCLELEQNRCKDDLTKNTFHRYEVEQLEVKTHQPSSQNKEES